MIIKLVSKLRMRYTETLRNNALHFLNDVGCYVLLYMETGISQHWLPQPDIRLICNLPITSDKTPLGFELMD